MTGNIDRYRQYNSLARKDNQIPQLNDYDRDLFARLRHDLPTKVNTRGFADKVRLFKVTMEHVDTLKQNRTKEILLGIVYTLLSLVCLALIAVTIGGMIVSGGGPAGILLAIAISICFAPIGIWDCYPVASFINVVDCVSEHEMQEAYASFVFADEVDSQEDLKKCIERHEPTAKYRIAVLSLLNCFIPFIYLYQACTSISRWEKVLEKQKERLTALAEHNNRLLAETRDYCGAHFHELDNAYSAQVQDEWDRNRVHALLQYHHKGYVQELAKRVASVDVLPNVLNTIAVNYL